LEKKVGFEYKIMWFERIFEQKMFENLDDINIVTIIISMNTKIKWEAYK